MEIKKLEKYLINKDKKTDMLSSLNKVDSKLIKEELEKNSCSSIKELALYKIKEFEDILEVSKDDIFTRMFFGRLVNNENSATFSAYEIDVETFNVFVYDAGSHYSYYIPDEIRKVIKKLLNI